MYFDICGTVTHTCKMLGASCARGGNDGNRDTLLHVTDERDVIPLILPIHVNTIEQYLACPQPFACLGEFEGTEVTHLASTLDSTLPPALLPILNSEVQFYFLYIKKC